MRRGWLPFLLAALAASVVLAAAAGSVRLPLGTTAGILLHALHLGGAGAWPGWQEIVLLEVRLPRVVVALLAGGGLGISGAVMQGLFRNPMAEPGVVGVSGGSALGAVLALYTGWASRSIVWLPVSAILGGLACAFLVYSVATSRGKTPISTLLLAGIAVGGMAISLTAFVLSLALANYEVGRQMVLWLMGGLEGRTWLHVRLAAPLVLGGSAWLCLYARDLNALATGEEAALSLGVDVARTRRDLLILSTLVTAATVAVAGVVGFVGLVVPLMLRLVLGPDHRRLLPACFLGGAVFVILADLFCRALIPGEELRLGVLTSMVGGPFFVWLLIRNRRGTEVL